MKHNSTENMKALFEPQAIAVIGASHDRNKIGYKIVENIVSSSFNGRVYPINPHGGEIMGTPIYKNITNIEENIDIAIITVPAKLVYEAVVSCGLKKIPFVLIITSGFSEVGNFVEEERIANFARQNNMRILGPNIFGIFSATASLNATFGPKNINPGNVAIITQSGALGLSMIGKTAVENIGLSAMISVGNKSDIDEADLLEYLISHDNTKVIMMYIEGVRNGQKLVSALKAATKKKPVIVIKAGRSQRGAMAAASHTGSLAGVDEIFNDIIKQCGVLRAESIKDAFDWCKYMANTPLPKGDNSIIITNGGGIGVMATDACEKYGIKLYDDSETLKEIFSEVTPEFGSTKNPIDITGQATSEHYNAAFTAALENDKVNSVIGLYCETAVFDGDKLQGTLQNNYENYCLAEKPITFSIFGGQKVENSIGNLRKVNVPVFADVYEAVSCLGSMYTYRQHLLNQSEEIDRADINIQEIEEIIALAQKSKRNFLLADEGHKIMQAAGICVPKSLVARDIKEAVKYARKIGFPVVMKIVSRDILHKSDVGGIALNLENDNEVMDAYQAIIHKCWASNPDAIIDGVEVAEMVRPGTEIIIGARRDKAFGPIVMFGMGGIYVEVMKDVAFRALPLNRKEIMGMIKQIRSYPLLLGVRGEGKKDIDAIVDTIIKLAEVIDKCKGISDIEINPLVVHEHGKGAKTLDVRVLLENNTRGDML